jgi:pimeloyl-ACP methyl ester carboxylesterase
VYHCTLWLALREIGFAHVGHFSVPGVSEDLLKEMGVRLIAIDRPGYGLSTPNPNANIADILEMGEKIYILGYSCGGAYTWGAARYIPERIAGIAMWAPVGSYWWKV